MNHIVLYKQHNSVPPTHCAMKKDGRDTDFNWIPIEYWFHDTNPVWIPECALRQHLIQYNFSHNIPKPN